MGYDELKAREEHLFKQKLFYLLERIAKALEEQNEIKREELGYYDLDNQEVL